MENRDISSLTRVTIGQRLSSTGIRFNIIRKARHTDLSGLLHLMMMKVTILMLWNILDRVYLGA